jgi:hypothetical protein
MWRGASPRKEPRPADFRAANQWLSATRIGGQSAGMKPSRLPLNADADIGGPENKSPHSRECASKSSGNLDLVLLTTKSMHRSAR